MDIRDFVRLYQVRGPQLNWLLGAGASANAGAPTAGDMISEFKASIYASREKVALELLGDLGDPRTREMLQRYFDTLGGFPPRGADDEYSRYFEEAYPKDADRQRYIDERVRVARPTFGHLVLALLLLQRRARHAWTTNMDRCIEDAVAQLTSLTEIVIADLGEPEKARRALDEGRLPIVAKLHGDYQSRHLKNSGPELAAQDADMRAALVDACGHGGLVVVGYSGRDRSVMDALREAASSTRPFPAGLFWIHRGDHPLHPAVTELIERVREQGAEAEVLEAPTFDEVMGDVLALQTGLAPEMLAKVNARRPVRLVESPLPEVTGRFPILRTNAFPISSWPTLARYVPCGVAPDWRALRDALGAARVLAAPLGRGVLAFGDDTVLKASLAPFRPGPLEFRPLDPASAGASEQYLLMTALANAIARDRPLTVRSRRTHRLLIPAASERETVFAPIRAIVGDLTGKLPASGLPWAEGIELQLVHALDRVFVVARPITHVDPGEREADLERTEFVNKRYEKRYNLPSSALLDAWRDLLIGPAAREVRALGFDGGTDAVFRIEPTTAFSYRMAA